MMQRQKMHFGQTKGLHFKQNQKYSLLPVVTCKFIKFKEKIKKRFL
jgi:hypothetical protein